MASLRNSESPDPLQDAVATSLGRYLEPGQSIIVGFSGGRDSTALLHALHCHQSRLQFQLSACHVNHGISPQANAWQANCQRYCESLAIPLEILQVDVPRGSPEGLEAAARMQRYAVFGSLSADWLALGQHQGDQAETVLFNLMRGTGLAGAAGMPETRTIGTGIRLLRPFLGIERKEIDAYLARSSIGWVEDESNADVEFSRNFMRHQVMPLLQSRFPAAERMLAAAAGRFAEARALLDELALLDLAGAPANFPVPLEILAKLSEPRGRNLLRYLLARQNVGIPSDDRLVEALRQLLDAMPDRHPLIVFGSWQLRRKRREVVLEPAMSSSNA